MIRLILVLLFIIVCIVMVVAILMQRARGGGLAGAFGGGGSDTVLGAIQNREMVKFTTYLAIAFVVLAVLLDLRPPKRKAADVETLNTPGVEMPLPGTEQTSAPAGETTTDPLAPIEDGGAEGR